jgi:hypothetical protein
VTVGLILAGALSIERTVMAGEGVLPYVIAAATVVILLRVKINPVFLILGGGAVTGLARWLA